jgi:hypothetical protein
MIGVSKVMFPAMVVLCAASIWAARSVAVDYKAVVAMAAVLCPVIVHIVGFPLPGVESKAELSYRTDRLNPTSWGWRTSAAPKNSKVPCMMHWIGTALHCVYVTPNMVTLSSLAAVIVMGACLFANLPAPAMACWYYYCVMDDVDGYMARTFNQGSRIGAILDLGTDATSHFIVTAATLCCPLVPCSGFEFTVALVSFGITVVMQQAYDDMLELGCGTPSVKPVDTAACALGFCPEVLSRERAKGLCRELGWLGHGNCRYICTPAIVTAFFRRSLIAQLVVLAAQLVSASAVLASCKLYSSKWHRDA